MSNLERDPQETSLGAVATADRVHEPLEGREVALGRYTVVRRYLPTRGRRTVGAWCFLDHFGPEDVTTGPGMRVPLHPHTGLQTVTWLLDGEVVHQDTVGSHQPVRAGELNLMTAGRGIAHVEESPEVRPPTLHGLQLWVALPSEARDEPPRFEHHGELPRVDLDGAVATVLVGEVAGARSPATAYTPLLGVDVALDAGADVRLPLDRAFEHAALVTEGAADVDGERLGRGEMVYLGTGRDELDVISGEPARLLLLGGAPFEEPLVMWWNFVARSHEEIVAARADWEAGRRFGDVVGYTGERLPAPPMPTARLRPRGRTG